MMEQQQGELQDPSVIQYNLSPRATPNPEMPGQDFFKFRLSGEDVLEEIEHKLRGEIYNLKKKMWETKYEPWCNEDGINVIISTVYDYANKHVFLGKLTKEEYFFKLRRLKKILAMHLAFNYKRYGIKKDKRELILKKVMDPIHSCLSQSEDGITAEQISTATQRIEHVQDDLRHGQPVQSQGIFNPIKRLFGR